MNWLGVGAMALGTIGMLWLIAKTVIAIGEDFMESGL